MSPVKWRRSCIILFLLGGLAAYWWWQGRLERSQDGPIRAAARRYGVAPALIKAVVWRESHFHPRARGRSEVIGLMQLQEAAAREWASAEHLQGFEHEHCFDPGTNTLAGTWYLRKLLRRYAQTDNPLPYALADYNAGHGNTLKWNQGAAATNSAAFIEHIGFPGTREYVRSVLRRYAHYRPLFRPDRLETQTREGERPRQP
jgi:soluble lytic murein transglycosylase